MFPEVLDREKFVALRRAFSMACLELGLGFNEVERHRLAGLMVSLAEGGDTDPDIIRVKAVHRMQPPAAGLFHAI